MVPLGGSTLAPTEKSVMLAKGGTSKPRTASQRASTFSRCDRNSISSFAAVLLRLKFQIPQENALIGRSLAFGPFGAAKVQQSAAMFGASRLATAHAEGGFQISALLP